MAAEITLCSSREEALEAERQADMDTRPNLIIRERQKYARVKLDMTTAGGHYLTEEAVAQATKIVEEYAARGYDDPEHKQTPISRGAYPGGADIGPLRHPIAREAAKELAEIAFEVENWASK